jgi:hypothetical protein
MQGDAALTWREVVERHASALHDELASRLDSEIARARADAAEQAVAETEARVAADADAKAAIAAAKAEQEKADAHAAREQAVRDARLSTAESLNQALRRIRQTTNEAGALAVLLEATAPYAQRAVVLRAENNQVRRLSCRGIEEREISFDLKAAAAVSTVFENHEPVVALASDNELSPELAAALSNGASGSRAYLFPIAARQQVMAVLAAAGECAPAALELLSEAAGMKIEAFETEFVPAMKPLPGSELVQIAPPAVPETPGAERLAWSDLSPDDQKLHLQAQRVARVKVAEMRLNLAEELRKGVVDADIYGALRAEIDRARADFLQTFLSKSRTMVDYLHLEILRSLAHDDDRLLGHEYPGPMV